MLKVRLQRTGKRGQAYFRVVVVEHTKKPRGKFLELLGNYDPHKKEFKVNMERVKHWVSSGAQVSPTANNLLVNYKYWDKPKMPSWKPKKKPTPPQADPLTAIQKGGGLEAGQATNNQQLTTQKETSTETTVEQKPAEEPKQEEVSAVPQPHLSSEASAKEEAQPAA